MYLEVIHEAQQTKRFLNYLVAFLISRMPFAVDQIIDLPILENSESFPHISEEAKKYSGQKFQHSTQAGISKTMLFSITKAEKNITDEIRDQAKRKELRRDAVVFYLVSLFYDSLTHLDSTEDINNPRGNLITFKVKDVDKLEKAIEKCRKLSQKENDTSPIFQENPPQVIWGSKIIGLEVGELPFYICKVAFSRPAKTMISWEEIVEEMDGPLKDVSDITSEKVRDSVRHFNNRIKEITDNNLFEWKNLSFYKLV